MILRRLCVKIFLTLIFLWTSSLFAQDYEMGRGLTLSEKLHVGGYISADYESSNTKKQFRLDDVAALAYGRVLPELSYMVEFEATPLYQKNYTTEEEQYNPRFTMNGHMPIMHFRKCSTFAAENRYRRSGIGT